MKRFLPVIISLVLMLILCAWHGLPRLAPKFTYEHSPFVGQVTAVMMHNNSGVYGMTLCGHSSPSEYAFMDLIYLKSKFETSVVPHLLYYTLSNDPNIRRKAGLMLIVSGMQGKNMYGIDIYDPAVFDKECITALANLILDTDESVSRHIINNISDFEQVDAIDHALRIKKAL